MRVGYQIAESRGAIGSVGGGVLGGEIAPDGDRLLKGVLGVTESIRFVIDGCQTAESRGQIGSVGGGVLGGEIAHLRKKALENCLGFAKLFLVSQYPGVPKRIFDVIRSILIGHRVVRQSIKRAKSQRVDLGASEMILRRAIDIGLITSKQLIVNVALFQLASI